MTGDEFVFRLEHLQAHYAMPWAEGMRDFHRLTTGEAEEWYWLLIRTQNIAQWEELRQAINRRYGDGRPDHERLQEIVERRQRRGESLEAYFQALWRLRSKLHSPISEAWMVKVAKRNLEEPLRQIIFPMQVYTKDHLRDSCLETERVFGGEQKKYNMGYRQREREEMRPGRLAELVESPTREETANNPNKPDELNHNSDGQISIENLFKCSASAKDKHNDITAAVVYMIYKDNLPVCGIEKEGLCNLLQICVPKYKIPSRFKVTDLIEEKYDICVAKIKTIFHGVEDERSPVTVSLLPIQLVRISP
ncbi:maker16 [Drosophila busckii]|uniref:Maker16 n=1 Tax=Drosophila busckii TaxID=30019 RepID=A0A0M4E436_DROBS|nr:maker16 [Drosophila busckii]